MGINTQPKKCRCCGLTETPIDHETCHIQFNRPKTYIEYLGEYEMTSKRIFYKYGAPPGAKPPGLKTKVPKTVDSEYRKNLLRRMNPAGDYKSGQA